MAQHPDARWLTGWTYAHRGLHDEARLENTMPAFMAAISAGRGIECDVQASGDGAAIVFHDWTLDRMTAHTGKLRACSAADLATVRCRCGTPIAMLAMRWRRLLDVLPALIEIKSRRGQPWHDLARSVGASLAGYTGPAAIMSFDTRIVRWFSDSFPNVPAGCLAGASRVGALPEEFRAPAGVRKSGMPEPADPKRCVLWGFRVWACVRSGAMREV